MPQRLGPLGEDFDPLTRRTLGHFFRKPSPLRAEEVRGQHAAEKSIRGALTSRNAGPTSTRGASAPFGERERVDHGRARFFIR